MNCRKGHHYLTVFAVLVARRGVFATEDKDHATFTRFAEEPLIGKNPKNLTVKEQVRMEDHDLKHLVTGQVHLVTSTTSFLMSDRL